MTISSLTTSGSRLALFKFWICENAMHIGVPMRRTGFSKSMRRSASALISGSLKFQGTPSLLHVVRSSARPGNKPILGCLRAASDTRGAE